MEVRRNASPWRYLWCHCEGERLLHSGDGGRDWPDGSEGDGDFVSTLYFGDYGGGDGGREPAALL
eukprot:8236017-Heterocapsa_arctica.AAC.1